MMQKKYRLNMSHGFTLIELLVAIIIIGVLGAVTLPSYLNQTFKARGAEAKSNLGTINRAQQSHRLMTGRMATNLDELDPKIGGKFYTYSIASPNSNNASATALLIPSITLDLKNYSSAVTQIIGSSTQVEFFGSVICETQQRNTPPLPAVAPLGPGDTGSCSANMDLVR